MRLLTPGLGFSCRGEEKPERRGGGRDVGSVHGPRMLKGSGHDAKAEPSRGKHLALGEAPRSASPGAPGRADGAGLRLLGLSAPCFFPGKQIGSSSGLSSPAHAGVFLGKSITPRPGTAQSWQREGQGAGRTQLFHPWPPAEVARGSRFFQGFKMEMLVWMEAPGPRRPAIALGFPLGPGPAHAHQCPALDCWAGKPRDTRG